MPGTNFLLHYRKPGTLHEPLVGAQNDSAAVEDTGSPLAPHFSFAYSRCNILAAYSWRGVQAQGFRNSSSPDRRGGCYGDDFLDGWAMRNRFPSSAPLRAVDDCCIAYWDFNYSGWRGLVVANCHALISAANARDGYVHRDACRDGGAYVAATVVTALVVSASLSAPRGFSLPERERPRAATAQ